MLKNNKKDYCVYFHVNPVKQEVFYVGAGNKKRPFSKYGRSEFWHKVVKKYNYEIIIIHENLSWEEVCVLEIKYIKQIGQRSKNTGPLVNLTAGGDGFIGLTPWNKGLTRETSEKVDKVAKLKEGKHLSIETKRKKSLALKGRKHTEEHIAKQVEGQRKRYKKSTAEEKYKIAKKVWETRCKNGTNQQTEEMKERIRKTLTGRKSSEETKKKISLALKGKKRACKTIQRDKEIFQLLSTKTVAELAIIYDLHITRIRQIYKQYNKKSNEEN